MTQEQLDHLMVMHVHKERTDKLDLKTVLNNFVSESEHRTSILPCINTLLCCIGFTNTIVTATGCNYIDKH